MTSAAANTFLFFFLVFLGSASGTSANISPVFPKRSASGRPLVLFVLVPLSASSGVDLGPVVSDIDVGVESGSWYALKEDGKRRECEWKERIVGEGDHRNEGQRTLNTCHGQL